MQAPLRVGLIGLGLLAGAVLQSVVDYLVRWLDGRYAGRQVVSDMNTRLSLVESRQSDQSQFQRDMLTRLDRMQESINTLSTSIAALAATQARGQ
jgi:hypothetical protein